MSKIEDINIQKKKPAFKVNDIFLNYLKKYNRVEDISIDYDDLMRYVGSVDVLDTQDIHTLWQRVYYSDSETNEYVIEFDSTFTQVSADTTSSYFDIYMEVSGNNVYFRALPVPVYASSGFGVTSCFNSQTGATKVVERTTKGRGVPRISC